MPNVNLLEVLDTRVNDDSGQLINTAPCTQGVDFQISRLKLKKYFSIRRDANKANTNKYIIDTVYTYTYN